MAQKQGSTETQITIKWKQVQLPGDFNMRRTLPAVKKLAADLKLRGQLQPIVVRNGGSKEQPYVVVCGARRMAAFAENGWQDREILAVVRDYALDDALGPIGDNFAENVEREDVDYFDCAERVNQLLTGTYPVLTEGLKAVPQKKEVVASLLSISTRSVEKFAKIFRDVAPEVVAKARQHAVPSYLWIRLSQIVGDAGLEKNARLEQQAKLQMELLDTWLDQKAELEGSGRQRSERSDKGKSKKGKKGKKKTNVEEVDWHAIDVGVSLDKKDRNASDYMGLLKKKAGTNLSKEDAILVHGALDMMRFLSGEITRLPFVTEKDWAELVPPPADEEDEEEVIEEDD